MRRMVSGSKMLLRVREGFLDLPEEGDFAALGERVDRGRYVFVGGEVIDIENNDIIEVVSMPGSFYEAMKGLLSESALEAFEEHRPLFRLERGLEMRVYARSGLRVYVKDQIYLPVVFGDFGLMKMDNGLLELPRFPVNSVSSLRMLVGGEFPYGFVFVDRDFRKSGYWDKFSGQENIAPMSRSIIKKIIENEGLG